VKLVPQVSYQRLIDFTYKPRPFGYTVSGTETGLAGPYRTDVSRELTGHGGIDVMAGSLGVSFTPKLYLGVAVNLWRNDAGRSDSRIRANSGSLTGTRTVLIVESTTFKGTSVNLGVLWKPSTRLSLGAVYKSAFDLEFTRELTNDTVSVQNVKFHTASRGTGTIRWPYTVAAGVAFMPQDYLTISLDFTRSNWSEATDTRTETTTVTQSNRATPTTTTATTTIIWPSGYDPSAPQTVLNQPGSDTRQVRFGLEYVIKRPKMAGLSVIPLRLGFYTDQQYYREYDGEPDRYLGFTAGAGLVWRRLSLDFAYLHNRGEFDSSYTLTEGGQTEKVVAEPFRQQINRFFVSTTVRF
jgi:long-subunit fatty acid transport protein